MQILWTPECFSTNSLVVRLCGLVRQFTAVGLLSTLDPDKLHASFAMPCISAFSTYHFTQPSSPSKQPSSKYLIQILLILHSADQALDFSHWSFAWVHRFMSIVLDYRPLLQSYYSYSWTVAAVEYVENSFSIFPTCDGAVRFLLQLN
jgi:hypothetical protein